MNQDPTLNQCVAVITYSYDEGICGFNKQASQIFLESFNLVLKNGFSFTDLSEDQFSTEFTGKLLVCLAGNPQTIVLNKNGYSLDLSLLPILGNDNLIDKVSIVINTAEKTQTSASTNIAATVTEYNKQVYSNLFYNNPDAVFSFDLDGNFVNVNNRSVEIAETTQEELLKMHFLPFITKEDQPKVLGHFQKALAGENQSYTANFLSTQGTARILEINNLPIYHHDKIIGVYGIAKDITKQRLAEKKVLDERKMLRAIIDNIPDYIFVKNREHKSILSNRKFYQQILGKPSDDSSLGYTPKDYFDSKKGEEIISDNEWVMNSGEAVINRPDTVINIDGFEEKVLLTKVPLKNQDEEIIGLVGIARDITETYLYNKKQELVFKVIKAFGDNSSLHDSMMKVLKIFCEDLDFDYAESYKVSINNQKLVRTAYWPEGKDLSVAGKIYEKGVGLPGMVWESGEMKVIRNEDERDLLQGMVLEGGQSIQSAVGFPIIFEGKLVSIFCLGSTGDKKKIETELLNDITLQIASAIERKRSQEQLNDFFQYSPNLIAVIGMDGFVKKINPSFIEKFGYTECEILTKPFIDFIHREDLEKTYAAISNLTVGGEDFEIRCKKKDGGYLWISWRFSQFFAEENVVFTYGTDITPLKKVHEELSENIKVRKLTQEKLAESEKKYRSLFDGSPLPMWVLDRYTLKFLKVNRAAIDLYGYSEEEFSGMTVRDLWEKREDKNIEQIISAKKESFFQVKVKHLKKNGEAIYVNVNSNPVHFDGHKARVSLVRNVTDRIIAEEKLLQREQRFKALVQDGSDLISIVDENYNYFYNSPASKIMFGLHPWELNGSNFMDHIHKDDLKSLEDQLVLLEKQKRVQLPSYRVKRKGNGWRWVETIVTNLKSEPAIGGIVMNSRDITEFVEQEKELIESLKRYDIVAKATSDVITDYDIARDAVKVSDTIEEVFGYKNVSNLYSGKWWNEKVHAEDRLKVEAAENRMKNKGLQNLTIEYRFRCADGSYKYVLDRSYLIFDSHKKPIRIIGSMQDITERKRNLIAIENHNKRLKEIAWTQSHLVRAPLAKVMGLVDLLLNYKDDFDDTEELLKNILNSANELDGIIRKIAVQTEKEL
ncbi:PAS domain S-box protein [Christiangramia sabulilitoris]|uniref:histidine kinase n=1 Tax=Christiangramia sabulilitoris TaxID=2583991 RepID=A0A550I2A7_9FLAO|nr:PAS domain S-box protein [Christiangramia sabulilitoris]TRO65090.1 PAS domain S-box protein [Christiangramia sabulilitoris]